MPVPEGPHAPASSPLPARPVHCCYHRCSRRPSPCAQPLLCCSGATATARSAFVEDAGAVLAQLGGGAVDAPADLGATGSRRLLATCDSRCPIWTCSYREKVVVNFGCFKLWGNPASFGYQVRYRKGRSGGAPTGRYPCNNPTWYSNYKGGMATCPTCQTSTYTMLDCNWP